MVWPRIGPNSAATERVRPRNLTFITDRVIDGLDEFEVLVGLRGSLDVGLVRKFIADTGAQSERHASLKTDEIFPSAVMSLK